VTGRPYQQGPARINEKDARQFRRRKKILKRELYDMLSSDVARPLKRRSVSKDDVMEDFEAFAEEASCSSSLTLTSD
jgi:hypothetical protein